MTLSIGAQSGHVNSSTNPFDDFKWDFNSAQLFGALLCGIIWCTFLTFYNSRFTGFIVTRLVNRFLLPNRKDCYVKFGSFSFSSLSGKIMFREFIYADHNMTVRIQDGFFHFRFWLPYSDDQSPPIKKFSNDPRLLPASKCRVSMHLNGLEVHAYNWLSRYARISRLFHLGGFSLEDLDKLLGEGGLPTATHFLDRYELRKLIPTVHLHVSSGHCAFGNKFMPSTLTVDFEALNSNYTTTRSSNDVDLFMHIFKGTCENFKMSFVKTPDFCRSDKYEKPPRIMGEGFVILQTSTLGFYHYQDEVAIVPLDRRRLHYVTDDVQAAWGTNVSLGKGTVISYGPWADVQRLKAFKFFFPEDFQVWPMTPRPGPGKKRLFTKYELKVNLLSDATLDLLFMRSDVPNAIHINFVKGSANTGSWAEVVLPWRIDENGCATQIQGQLLMFDSSTSLEYRHFLSGETLSFSAILGYPRAWFEHHCWEFLIKISKARLKFLYAHKSFLQDLINEWIKDSDYDDPNCFVPYTYVFDVKIDDFELTLLCNDKNWIDTSSQAEENCYIGLKGENLVFNSSLPFVKFYQSVYDLKNYLTCENLRAKFYLPDQHLLKHDLQALYESSLVQNHGCTLKQDLWSNAAKGADGWFDCWAAPTVSLSISYVYHSMLKGKEQNKPISQLYSVNHKTVDLSSMDPDLMTIDIELGSSVVFLSAAMIKFIFIMKGNYLGECNKFTDIQLHSHATVKQMFGQFLGMTEISKNTLDDRKKKTNAGMTAAIEELDLRNFRPFNVKLSLTLHDVQGHVLTQGLKSDSHCPVVFTDQFVFELDKNFDECLIQLSIAPVLLHNVNPNSEDSNRPPSTKKLFVEEGLNLGYQHGVQLFILTGTFNVQCKYRFVNNGAKKFCCKETTHICTQGMNLPYPKNLVEVYYRPKIWQNFTIGQKFGKSFFRGHGLYSPEGLPVDAPTTEYAWMIEFLIGRIEGTLTMPQLTHVISAAKMFLDHLINNEDSLIYPKNLDLCHHMCPRLFCAQKCRHTFPSRHTDSEQEESKRRQAGVGCSLESDLKYKMFRFSADDVNIFVVDGNTALHLKAKPIRFSMCTEHLSGGEEGGCLNIGSLKISQFIRYDTQFSNANGPASSQNVWVECGLVELNFPTIQIISPWTEKVSNERAMYQKFHDSRTHRLWFIQSKNLRSTLMPYVCGCRGNCMFYGSNANGHHFDVGNIHQEMNNDQKKSITLAAYNILSTVSDMGSEPSTSNVASKTTLSSAFGRSLLRTGEAALRLFNDRSSCSSNVYSITAAATSGMSSKMSTSTNEVVRISPESGTVKTKVYSVILF
uniref:Bridge-like lipid transfer protein family member 1 N-terminal domain-containing protein n=1 Tax=Romanomermis culicivorax TaxID=13658 RepID=A0A915K762_ROMCU